jgi:phenylacetic acid degradation protein
MPVYQFGGGRPVVDPTSFVHPDAVVLGHVVIGPRCFIGPGAYLRGDWVAITVGEGSNVQEASTVHGYPGTEVILGADSHLGHGCIIHGARLADDVLVGMNAVIQDDAVLEEGCIVGSGCVVPAGFVVPARKLAVGVPARIVGDVSPEQAGNKRRGTIWYQQLAARCLYDLREVPLSECLLSQEAWGAVGSLRERLSWVKELEGLG